MATIQYPWTHFSEQKLLNTRLCDLGLTLDGHPLQKSLEKLYSELENKGIKLRPHVYISDDWFCPDGTISFTIPFFLLHPRLKELERRFIGEVEGETQEWFMKLIRHEMGHAVDNAFKLRKIVRRRSLFGASHIPYPTSYDYRPYSKNYVRHIEEGYAQSHPDEDWAETFAVWLDPKSNWKKEYKSWPALRKIELLESIMKEKVLKKSPLISNDEELGSINTLTITLKEYFEEKRKRFGIDKERSLPKAFDTFFPIKNPKNKLPLASQFLRKNKKHLSQVIGLKTEEFQYRVDQALDHIIKGCEKSHRRLPSAWNKRSEKLVQLLAVQVKDFIKRGDHKVIM